MTYEEDLELKIEKYAAPFTTVEYIDAEGVDLLKHKLREYFLDTRVELLDIRVVGKIQDILAEFNISPAYAQTAMKVSEVDGKFTVVVTIDPDDPDPVRTLEFIATEFNNLHPGVEVTVTE